MFVVDRAHDNDVLSEVLLLLLLLEGGLRCVIDVCVCQLFYVAISG